MANASDTADSVRWGHTLIAYRYRYTERKTLAITVNPDLSVVVVAPLGTELGAIREKVRKRGSWIKKAWHEFELYLPKLPPRRYVNGETHRYLGRQYRLLAERGEVESVKCLRGYFRVTSPSPPTEKSSERLLEGWYRQRAEKVFQERLDVCQARAKRESITATGLTIRKMKTRWGSCSKTGRILLNLELMQAPKECIDYVIMHELCHLKEHHHGPKFWQLLKKLMPDYESRKKRLDLIADN